MYEFEIGDEHNLTTARITVPRPSRWYRRMALRLAVILWRFGSQLGEG